MNIFEFSDYRKFLRSFVENRQNKGRGEAIKIAKHLNVHPTFIGQVLRGEKHLSGEQALGMCSHIGLSPLETDYFMVLVKGTRAGTEALKSYYESQLTRLRDQSLNLSKQVKTERVLTDAESAIFYSSWIYSAIRNLCSLHNDGVALEQIVERLKIDRQKALNVLEFLVEQGLCTKKNGLYLTGVQRTHLASTSPFLLKHHTNWRLKALQKFESLDKSELMYTAPLSISKKDFAGTRDEIVKLIQRLSDRVKTTNPEDVACVNFDLFWL